MRQSGRTYQVWWMVTVSSGLPAMPLSGYVDSLLGFGGYSGYSVWFVD